MKRIQACADKDAIERITTALRETGLSGTAKIHSLGGTTKRISLYVKDDETLAAVMLVKHAAYAKGRRNGTITIHGVNSPTQRIN